MLASLGSVRQSSSSRIDKGKGKMVEDVGPVRPSLGLSLGRAKMAQQGKAINCVVDLSPAESSDGKNDI